MGHEPISINALIEQSGLCIEAVSSILLILELNNQVSRHETGKYIRRNTFQF
jgi:DNA processing protein